MTVKFIFEASTRVPGAEISGTSFSPGFLPYISAGVEIEQVCSNKDASEGRDEDRIAERYLPDLIAGCLLQIIYRYIADCLQVYCRFSAVFLQVICY